MEKKIYDKVFHEITGKEIERIEIKGDHDQDDFEQTFVVFHFHDGSKGSLKHYQDCCEEVSMVDVVGYNPKDLENSTILEFRLSTFWDEYGENQSTFYHLQTDKGYITFVFHGNGNGYYSLEVTWEYKK